jgi:hypothetical protein
MICASSSHFWLVGVLGGDRGGLRLSAWPGRTPLLSSPARRLRRASACSAASAMLTPKGAVGHSSFPSHRPCFMSGYRGSRDVPSALEGAPYESMTEASVMVRATATSIAGSRTRSRSSPFSSRKRGPRTVSALSATSGSSKSRPDPGTHTSASRERFGRRGQSDAASTTASSSCQTPHLASPASASSFPCGPRSSAPHRRKQHERDPARRRQSVRCSLCLGQLRYETTREDDRDSASRAQAPAE